MEMEPTMKTVGHRIRHSVTVGMLLSFFCLLPAYAGESREGGGPQTQPAQADAERSPSIQIDEKAYDFGEVPEGSEITHVFVVKNPGGAPLQITQVRPG
jgi:hypothetical protein